MTARTREKENATLRSVAFQLLAVFLMVVLEGKLRGQLDSPWAAAAKERIADANVAGRRDLISAIAYFAIAGNVEAAAAA